MPSIISCGGQVPQLPRRKSPCGDVPWIMPPHGIPHSPRLPVMTINGMRPDEHGNLDISIPVVDTNIIQGSNNPVSGGAVWTGLEGKANAIHTHLISEIDNLQATLNGKSDVGHRHTIPEIDQLIDTLGNYTPKLDYNILAGEVLKNQGAITSLQTEVASKADKVPEGYGNWEVVNKPNGYITVKDGNTVGFDWRVEDVEYRVIFPLIRNNINYPPGLESAPYHMRFRYVSANQVTSTKSIYIILPQMLISFIDEDTGVKTYYGDSVQINFSSAEDTNTPREFEITRYNYISQTPVCVVRMRKI